MAVGAPFIPKLGALGPYEGKTSWEIKMPEIKLPDYQRKIPKMDQGVISGYKQEAAATGMRGLRNALRESVARTGALARDNPFAAQQQRRSALAGYGQGLGDVMTSATREALQRYAPEYQAETQAVLQGLGAETQAALKAAELEILPQIEQMKAEMAQYAKYLGLKSMAPMIDDLAEQFKRHVAYTAVKRVVPGAGGAYHHRKFYEGPNFNPFDLFRYA